MVGLDWHSGKYEKEVCVFFALITALPATYIVRVQNNCQSLKYIHTYIKPPLLPLPNCMYAIAHISLPTCPPTNPCRKILYGSYTCVATNVVVSNNLLRVYEMFDKISIKIFHYWNIICRYCYAFLAEP